MYSAGVALPKYFVANAAPCFGGTSSFSTFNDSKQKKHIDPTVTLWRHYSTLTPQNSNFGSPYFDVSLKSVNAL